MLQKCIVVWAWASSQAQCGAHSGPWASAVDSTVGELLRPSAIGQFLKWPMAWKRLDSAGLYDGLALTLFNLSLCTLFHL